MQETLNRIQILVELVGNTLPRLKRRKKKKNDHSLIAGIELDISIY